VASAEREVDDAPLNFHRDSEVVRRAYVHFGERLAERPQLVHEPQIVAHALLALAFGLALIHAGENWRGEAELLRTVEQHAVGVDQDQARALAASPWRRQVDE